ncbi:MAG: polyprenyl synthetase family protein [Beijerinckiaceae bacterium]
MTVPLAQADETFAARLATVARRMDEWLDALLASPLRPGEIARPERLMAAMRHAALAGGKRLRPFLLIETARLFGRDDNAVWQAAAALECVHCYSLVHDDLPAMDDDDLRRGQPTVHRAFDEATAILAGDGLLTYAFDLLASLDTSPAERSALVLTLARSAGIGGMVGGQLLDLTAEGRFSADGRRPLPTVESVRTMQSMKTGALILAAVQSGAILGGADESQRAALDTFGQRCGAAFQIADDLLDVEASAETLGKAAGKDDAKGKATLVNLLGLPKARQLRDQFTDEAVAALSSFGERAAMLANAARFIAQRGY